MKRLRAVLPCLLLVLPVLADDAIAPGDNLVLDGIPPIGLGAR